MKTYTQLFNDRINSTILFVLVVTSLSCNKVLGKTCWDCEITRVDGTTYNDKVCLDDGETPGGFTDDRGNDLNSFCTKR